MGAIDECPPRGEGVQRPAEVAQEPRGSGPLPWHSKNISLFTERRTSERAVSKDGYSSFLFNPLWGFPVVAAGILFVVDQRSDKRSSRGSHEMRKPGRGQILENRLVGPREVLGGGDRRVPAKGRGRTAPCRGRSGASWIWATPLTPARARGSSERAVSKDGYSSFLFNPLWGFPVVAAGILFVVDQLTTRISRTAH